MGTQLSTTPFGRRAASLGQLATRAMVAKAIEEAGQPGANVPAAVNKWHLFRTLTAVRERLGVSDRALAVLNALLSFHPETALTLPKASQMDTDGGGEGESCELIVFPSNRQLQARAHGVAETTLRRHLAALVSSGLILRRDSANGKRYARREDRKDERFSEVFGFDLTPLVARIGEFEALNEELQRERRLIQSLKTRITLHRRDISKMIALGLDEGLAGPWEDYRQWFMGLVMPLRSLKGLAAIEQIHADLATLLADITNTLNSNINAQNINGNDAQNKRHISNSKTNDLQNLEPSPDGDGGDIPVSPETAEPALELKTVGIQTDLPLALVIEACPDVTDYHYAGGKITTWPSFQRAAEAVRPMIGISPDAWYEACRVLTPVGAAIAVAMILQRSEYSSEARTVPGVAPGSSVMVVNGSPVIISAGGYLRALTDKARAGEFTPGPMLMALIGQRAKVRRAKPSTSNIPGIDN
ncbi:MAG: plasmid replication protein RepC [Beijerinckiaceae bacterium]